MTSLPAPPLPAPQPSASARRAGRPRWLLGWLLLCGLCLALLSGCLADKPSSNSVPAPIPETTPASSAAPVQPASPPPQLLPPLPAQAYSTYALILSGGPFPYAKDGSVFGNRERLLPAQKHGYYREYTVPTPKAKNRGARRIVCGGWQPTKPAACYYTADHYESFTPFAPPTTTTPAP